MTRDELKPRVLYWWDETRHGTTSPRAGRFVQMNANGLAELATSGEDNAIFEIHPDRLRRSP